MNDRDVKRPALRVNLLAAALAMALPLGVAAQQAGQQSIPHWNKAPNVTRAAPASMLFTGLHNQPFRSLRHSNVTQADRPAGGFLASATLPVTSCADDGSPGTLRAVIQSATANDVIDLTGLTCSVITLQQGVMLFDTQNLAIQGPGRNQLTIDGNAASAIFAVTRQAGTTQSLSMSDVTLTNGQFAFGGCVYVSGDLNLSNVTIGGCRGPAPGATTYGGAVDVKGSLLMNNSVISGNVAEADAVLGGGAYVGDTLIMKNGSVLANNKALAHGPAGTGLAMGGGAWVLQGADLTGSRVSGNLAKSDAAQAYGGGILLFGLTGQGPVAGHVVDSVVSGNTARSMTSWAYGGGIAAGMSGYNPDVPPHPGQLQVSNSTIHGNTVYSGCADCTVMGGGLRVAGTISVDHSTISGNRAVVAVDSSATAYGGGLATRSPTDGTITISESTISNNAALGRAGSSGGFGMGGGIASPMGTAPSPVHIHNSTIAFNQASDTGGGVLLSTATGSSFTSTMVANNRAPHASGIAARGGYVNNNPTVVLAGDHNLVQSASANIQLPLDTLSLDPMLRPLAMNGGATKTHALRPASPAINAGSNPDGDACDQRGNPYGRSAGGGVDIGAFEWQAVPTGPLQGPGFIFANGFDAGGPCS